jgi:glycerol uptake facilitator-like aquaporin
MQFLLRIFLLKSMATRRKSASLKAGRHGGFENVDATSRFELVPDTVEGGEKSMTQRWLGLTGKHSTPTWQGVTTAFIMELVGTALLGSSVALARWAAFGGSQLLNGFAIGLVYALNFWIATRQPWYGEPSMRRHLSGPVTLAYFLTNEIGLLGVVFYKLAQTIGTLIGGAVLSALIGGVYVAGKLPVPLPVTTLGASSLTTAVCLEIFITAILILIFLISEFLNTDESKKDKNYKHATTYMAGAVFVTVIVLFQFGSYSFNDNVYLTGLFSGFGKATSDPLSVSSMAALNSATYTDSVFGTGGAAWALYYFGPWAGGVIGAALFWAIFMIAGSKVHEGTMFADKVTPKYVGAQQQVVDQQLQQQTQLGELVNPLKR